MMSIEEMRLATVELVASSQDYKDNSQGLQANVWFPPQEGSFEIDGKTIVMRYGFVEAYLQISDTRNSTYHEVRKILLAEETVKSSSDTFGEKKNELGGGLKLPPMPILKGNAQASSQNATTTRESREVSRTRSQYIAEEIDKGRWRLSGCAHDDNLLDGKIIDMDGGPLCTLKWDEGKATATKPLKISAKLSTTQRHLKAVIADDDHGRTLPNTAERAAVVQAVIARAMRNRRAAPDPDDKSEALFLASDHCTASLYKAAPDE